MQTQIVPECICGSDQASAQLLIRGFSGYPYRNAYRCTKCQSICLYPAPLNNTYNKADYMSFINWKEYLGYFLGIYNPVSKYIEPSHSAPGVRTLLDYGCGSSRYAEYFRLAGYKAFGFDINDQLVNRLENCQSSPSQKIYFSDYTKAVKNGPYDVVLCNQVIEHVNSPLKLLQDISQVIHSGSHIIITTPSCKSINRKLLRSKWIGYSPDEHIWLLSEAGMKQLATYAGLRVIASISNSCCGKKYDYFSPRRSLVAKLYYKIVMPIFEWTGYGDQIIFVLKHA